MSEENKTLQYIVAFEKPNGGFTVRANTDVSQVRFIPVAAFNSFEEADWFIDFVKDCGGFQKWKEFANSWPKYK